MLHLLFNLLFHFSKEGNDMAAIYCQLIIKGKRTFSQVPKKLQPQVKEMLIDLELEYLIDEN